jgi:organic hydroperoxide reductase OsmC/OhrA
MAHTYTALVAWERGADIFTDRRYSRAHTWQFDGGTVVPASSSPLSVRLPMSREDAVDPEEAFVASISSCHMLFFLDFAAREGFCIDSYRDAVSGVMEPDARGKFFVSRVTLAPDIVFSGPMTPTQADVARLHHRAHDDCFIANSVKAEVTVADVPLRLA